MSGCGSGNLLRQGLRSEAIRLAEAEPVLLDVVAILDFPERQQWVATLGRFGIARPAGLLVDLAAELNEAYAQEQPLAPLLARHRLLAISQAPLRMRIETLREIAGLEQNNPIWQEDLLGYERERQKQVEREVTEAANAGDAAWLATLDGELRDTPWLAAPPAQLLDAPRPPRKIDQT